MKQKDTNIKICENCKYVYDSFLVDNKNPFCRFKERHHGTSCGAFKKYTNTEVKNNE